MTFPTPPNSTATTNVNAAFPTTILLQLQRYIPLSLYWIEEQNKIGARVARYRRYYEGDHDASMTTLQMLMLDIKDKDDGFAINMCKKVVDTKADRIVVQGIEGVEDVAERQTEQNAGEITPDQQTALQKDIITEATTWAQEIMDNSDFDAIQGDLHMYTVRDGNAYLMVSWDNDEKQVKFTIEPAWDGQTGMIMVYRSHQIAKPFAAIKIWQIEDASPAPTTPVGGNGQAAGSPAATITTRCNIYYPDRIEKYIGRNFGMFEPFDELDENGKSLGAVQPWVDGKNQSIGIPVIHFRNGGRENYGQSELRDALSPQNALNKLHASSIISAMLTAFPIYVQVGFERDTDAVMPGMVIKIPNAVANEVTDFKKIEGSPTAPLLEMVNQERQVIAEVTSTPSPDLASGSGSNKSGEFLKQLEVGLIGKVNRFTTHAGSSWVQVFDIAWLVQNAFGTLKPPSYKRFICHWQSPEMRNDAEVVANSMLAFPVMGQRQTLRNMSEVWSLDEEKIDSIVEETMQNDIAKAQAMQAQPSDTVNTASGKVSVTEPPQTIGADGQLQAQPAVQGSKLPSDQATNADHLTKEHMANLFDQYHATKKPSSAPAPKASAAA